MPHDVFETYVPHTYMVSKLFNGNFEHVKYFLSGEYKWYHLEKLFYPVNLLHLILDIKYFYFFETILQKLFGYFSFFLLAKSLNNSKFISSLGALLYVSILSIKFNFGFGLYLLPYLLYLLNNKKFFKTKHYISIIFVGASSSLVFDIYAFFLIIPFSYLITKSYNFKNYFIYAFLILFFTTLSDINLVYTLFSDVSIHRSEAFLSPEFMTAFFESFRTLFLDLNFYPYYHIFSIFLLLLYIFLFLSSPFSKNNFIRITLLSIIFILFLRAFVNSNLFSNLFFGKLEFINLITFMRVDKMFPLLVSLLFTFTISNYNNKKIRNFLILLSIISVTSIQLSTSMS